MPREIARVVGARAVDAGLVERFVPQLRQLVQVRGLEAAIEVGELVLETFYGGSISMWRRLGTDHQTVAAVAAHPELGVTRYKLWNHLRLLEQLDDMKGLGANVTMRLTFSHHKALYAVTELALKRRLAASAVRAGWTVEELRDQVQAALGPGEPERGGRPRDTPLTKLLKGLRKATSAVDPEDLDVGAVRGLPPEARRDAVKQLERVGGRLLELARSIRALDAEELR